MAQAKKLTIIIVAKNHIEQTKKCLEALHKYTDPSIYKIIFMDNGCTDETISWVPLFCSEHGIECHYEDNENIGWVKAINIAYSMVDTEYSITMHNDCYVTHKDWLSNMLRRFTNNVAAVGPMISFAMGPQAAAYINTWFNAEPRYLLGLFFMCKSSVLEEVREFYKDEGSFYLAPEYGLGDKEELELCWVIRKLGYRFRIARDVYIEHDGEKSFVDTLGSQKAFHEYQNKQLEILRKRLGDDEVQAIYTVEEKKPIKIMVGFITRTEYVHYKTFISFLKIWGFTQCYKSIFHVSRGHSARDRNKIVREFLKSDCTHLLFIDDDMFFEHDAIIKLINHDVDIASGIAWMRGEPHEPCVFHLNTEEKSIHPVNCQNMGMVEVDATGGFFLLIKRKVLETVKAPWFIFGDTSLGLNMSEDIKDEEDRGIGEDLYFTVKARMAGFDIWCDSDLIIRHLGKDEEIDDVFVEAYRKSGKYEKALKAMGKWKKE